MDEIQLIIYIVFGIIYFLFRSLGKKNQSKQPRQNAEQEQGRRPKRTKTFEELLRELSGEVTEEEEPYYEQEKQVNQVNDWSEQDETSYLREMEEKADRYKTLDEQVDLEDDSSLSVGLLKDNDESESVYSGFASQIATDLKDPEEIRKAIVMSEILNRKYD